MIKSTILFVIVNIVVGCCTFRDYSLITEFPPKPELVDYTKDPVINNNKKDKTYTITEEYMHNSLLLNIYIDEIRKWKTENGIK